jgi:hypothetical protein
MTPTAVAQLVVFFENINADSVGMVDMLYDPNARFVDPFNDVQGVANIRRIFAHMFVALEAPRFVVTHTIIQGKQCFLTWDFHFRFKSFQKDLPQTIRGGSHLVFSEQGLVTLHRDYWDAAEELYEKLPLVGSLMRWLKKRANS